MSRLFASGSQSIGASASVLLMIYFRIDWFDLLAVQGDSQESSPAPQFEGIISSALNFLYGPTLTSVLYHWKNMALTIQTFVSKVMSLFLNTLSRFVPALLPWSKHFNFMAVFTVLSEVSLELKKIKSVTASTFPPSICHEVMGLDSIILVF